MSKKIIGNTVGTTLPRPSFAQTDPKKGDYIKDKEVLDTKYVKIDAQELTEEQKAQVKSNIGAEDEIYILQEGETLDDAPDYVDVVYDSNEESLGFDVGQFATKEDVNELSEAIADLENKIPSGGGTGTGGNGWSNEEITLLGTILRSTVTSSDQTANIDALVKMLQTGSSGNEGSGGGDDTGETYTVTLNLTNVVPSNLSQTAASGSVYVNTLSVSDGYAIGMPVITMGGFDVTSQYYDGAGTISIPDVQGDIVIICKALAVETLRITRATALPSSETFEWTAGNANYWVAEQSAINGGKMHVEFDNNVCTGWSFVLYLFRNGSPYKVSANANNTANGDGVNVTLANPAASGFGYITVTAPFDYDVPDGCTVMLGIRRGSSTSPDGSIVSNANFADWMNGGGIVATVTEVE